MKRGIVSLILVVAAAAPAFAELQIRDIKPMYGLLGPQRKSLDVFPGDEIFFTFFVAGAAVDEKGNVNVTTTVEAFDPDGKQVLNQTGATKGALALGGGGYPGVAQVNFGTGVPIGDYKVTVTVHDLTKDASTSFDRKVSIKPPDFTFIKLHFSYDDKGATPAPVGGVVSQRLFYSLKVLGFDKSQKKIKVVMKVQVLDEKDREMMPEPLTVTVASENENEVAGATDLSFNANISLNRPGAFTLRITLTDEIAKKSVSLETPLKVSAP